MNETYPLTMMELVEHVARNILMRKRRTWGVTIERKDPPYLRVYFPRDRFGVERNIHFWTLGYNQLASEANAWIDDEEKHMRRWTRRTLSIITIEATFADHDGNLTFTPSSRENVEHFIEEAYAQAWNIRKRDLNRQDQLP